MFSLAVLLLPRVGAAQPLRIYAAGSLTAAFTAMVKAFPAPSDSVATPVFGPSGLLREKIEHGDAADLLASAAFFWPTGLM
jgi:ABC-type molybdate transport system substrate-binding protein